MSNTTKEDAMSMQQLICIMMLFYLIQTYGCNPGLFGLPVTIYLKQNLGLSPAQLASFSSFIFIPWLIRPLYGIIGDAFSIFGYQFKSYFFICYSLALVVLLGLAGLQVNTITQLATGLILVNLAIAFSDVFTDKIMVVQGRILNNTARLQAAQWTALSFGQALLSYIAGWIAQNSNLSLAFVLTAIVPFVGLAGTFLLLRNEKKHRKTVSVKTSVKSIWSAVKSRQFLAVMGFIACLEFTLIPPLVNYLVYYYKDALKFDAQFIGILGTFEALANGLGAIAFGMFAFRISRRLLLNLAIGLTTLSTIGLLFIYNAPTAIFVSLFFGFFSMVSMLGVLEIAARSCPVGAEGSTYAILKSVYQIVRQPGPILGGYLYGWGVPVYILVIISAVFTMFCWFLIPLFKLEQESIEPQEV
ncbi:MFS transporter [Aetokthonos hydrillicola Thurmond2011]|jgi:MFS family permease|uniref:MFS transporter n=1 Tax=Aetokthonos hydrillicola Thurmond2011 TaxID=2712845 RepID=A0AAP5IEN9_9CYAN|nr:MFS transporter [Aetokthonos hydrillicola]MBO3459190.1 folate/biopterin family MFS transporter [Aetokthonos hydrillicola CCALA 1050]MBW4584149.1 MFS transporter [Aetokthonos hydrillicola CCALA 1050]MDR9898318.1 MFS transporter [Aetokthonos hydrillicola Thurmond2011]